LDETTTLRRTILDLTPLGHPDHRLFLVKLADCVYGWFRATGAKEDLDKAIAGALDFPSPGNSERSSVPINLADRLYEIHESTAGLDEVITLWRVALELTPSDHRERPSTLVNISDRLKEWFRKLGFVVDLADSINLRRAASELALPRNHDHPPSRIAL
ncbi:hypothetical protein F5J12DRAFT_705644, partial [Pisolithus orientalis]|uniref:uncharacterized protein n=1 Tax=Pisolithus orientalis TaxID=936130 RepID=UPI002224646C